MQLKQIEMIAVALARHLCEFQNSLNGVALDGEVLKPSMPSRPWKASRLSAVPRWPHHHSTAAAQGRTNVREITGFVIHLFVWWIGGITTQIRANYVEKIKGQISIRGFGERDEGLDVLLFPESFSDFSFF